MDPRLFATVFTTVFVTELGDKTQLATMLYAADEEHPKTTVFLASAAALDLSSAIGVAAGGMLSQLISTATLRWGAGVGFVGVGLWILSGRWISGSSCLSAPTEF
ncbi:MAG: TMEM165/GDT1 family protein [Myxococcota bacterium]